MSRITLTEARRIAQQALEEAKAETARDRAEDARRFDALFELEGEVDDDRDCIEELQSDNVELRRKLKKHDDNPTLLAMKLEWAARENRLADLAAEITALREVIKRT